MQDKLDNFNADQLVPNLYVIIVQNFGSLLLISEN